MNQKLGRTPRPETITVRASRDTVEALRRLAEFHGGASWGDVLEYYLQREVSNLAKRRSPKGKRSKRS